MHQQTGGHNRLCVPAERINKATSTTARLSVWEFEKAVARQRGASQNPKDGVRDGQRCAHRSLLNSQLEPQTFLNCDPPSKNRKTKRFKKFPNGSKHKTDLQTRLHIYIYNTFVEVTFVEVNSVGSLKDSQRSVAHGVDDVKGVANSGARDVWDVCMFGTFPPSEKIKWMWEMTFSFKLTSQKHRNKLKKS